MCLNYHHTYSITKRSYRRTHTHNRHATLHMNVSKHCAATHHIVLKLKKKCNLEICNIFFWNFFRTLLKKTYSRNVYFKFFLALRQKQYTRLCFPKFTFLFLCLSSLCSAAAVGGGGALPDKCVEGHFRKTVKFGS